MDSLFSPPLSPWYKEREPAFRIGCLELNYASLPSGHTIGPGMEAQPKEPLIGSLAHRVPWCRLLSNRESGFGIMASGPNQILFPVGTGKEG